MEIMPGGCSPVPEVDRQEGQIIESLRAASARRIPDPSEWLDEELKRNVMTTTVDGVLNWARSASLWPLICFTACCTFEVIATSSSRYDIARFGMEVLRASPRQSDLMITAGTLTWKMAPQIKRSTTVGRTQMGSRYGFMRHLRRHLPRFLLSGAGLQPYRAGGRLSARLPAAPRSAAQCGGDAA